MPRMSRTLRHALGLAGALTALAVTAPSIAIGSSSAANATRPGTSSGVAVGGPRPALPWIEDDYAGAVAAAKARKLPIFVESWAPW